MKNVLHELYNGHLSRDSMTFEKGIPPSVNGVKMKVSDIIRELNRLGGKHGIGIVDIMALFGASSVEDEHNIDMVIKLEDWNKDKDYDRLGLEEEYTEYLGNKIVCHNIPIRPGRNLAIICESAAVNYRQKKMGYNAAQELYSRLQNQFKKKSEDDE